MYYSTASHMRPGSLRREDSKGVHGLVAVWVGALGICIRNLHLLFGTPGDKIPTNESNYRYPQGRRER